MKRSRHSEIRPAARFFACCARDMTAGEIAEQFTLARSTLSGHFNVLRHAGLIVAEKHGTSVVYSLNLSVVDETVAAVLDLFNVVRQRKKAR